MTATVILVEARPRRVSDGVRLTVRLAGGGDAIPYRYGGNHWWAGIAALPASVASLDFDGEQVSGGGVPNALRLQWASSDRQRLATLAAYWWKDADVTVRLGPEGSAMPPIDTVGKVVDVSIDAGVLTMTLTDVAADLKRALLVDRFLGIGGVEGPTELEGVMKARAWGRCWNVRGRQLVAAANIWCFGDPRRPWQAFDQVRDRGVAASDVVLLGWQGTPGATLNALIAAAAPAGGCVVCPSIACVKWWTQPAGDLHADIRGETDGGYAETAPAIAARIVGARSTLPFVVGAVDAASAARPAPFGYYVADESTTAAAAVSMILGDVGLSWVVVDGAIDFRRWDWTAPVRTARSEGVARQKLVTLFATKRVGYRRNQSVMARGDLAGIVLAQDVVFDDGSTAAVLKERIARIASDSWLTQGEKPEIAREWAALESSHNAVLARYQALGSPAEASGARDAAQAAVSALSNYLVALQPYWSDTTQDTPINGPEFNGKWNTARDKVEIFAAAILGRPGRDGTDGTNGLNGADGRDGADGRTPQFHFAWANSPDGAVDFTIGDQQGRVFQGVYVDYDPGSDSTNPASYTWSRFTGQDGQDGANGIDGADGTKIHKAYANSADGHVDFSITVSAGKRYLGLRVDYQVADSTNPDDYAWTEIKGADGADGLPGADALSVSAAPETVTIACDFGGNPKPGEGSKASAISVVAGLANVTAQAAISVAGTSACGATVSGAVVTLTAFAADSGYADLTISYGGASVSKRITFSKARDGAPGNSGSANLTVAPATGSWTDSSSVVSLAVQGAGTISGSASWRSASAASSVSGGVRILYRLQGAGTWSVLNEATNAVPAQEPFDVNAYGTAATSQAAVFEFLAQTYRSGNHGAITPGKLNVSWQP